MAGNDELRSFPSTVVVGQLADTRGSDRRYLELLARNPCITTSASRSSCFWITAPKPCHPGAPRLANHGTTDPASLAHRQRQGST